MWAVAPAPNLLSSLLPDLSFGGLLGFAAGYAIKKVGLIALFIVGAIFILVQLLAYQGLLTVNWLRVQALAEPALRQGGEQLGSWMLRVLQTNLPFGGAFVAGLLIGLRMR